MAQVSEAQVLAFMPLVKSIANDIWRTIPKRVPLDDLISSGTLGLLDAFEKFRPEESKFQTYARHRIRGSILGFLRSQDWISRSLRQKLKKLEREDPTFDANVVLSELGPEGADPLIPIQNSSDPLELLLEKEKGEQLQLAIDKLGKRSALVMRLYYWDEKTMREIGSVLGISESRVSQLHTAALGRLKRLAEATLS